MASESGSYFRSDIDVTDLHVTVIRTWIGIGSVFFVISGTVIGMWLSRGWPSLKEVPFVVQTMPVAAIFVVVQSAWRPMREWLNRPILRNFELVDDLLMQRDACGGRKHFVTRASNLVLDGSAIAWVGRESIILNGYSGGKSQFVAVPKGAFVDEAAEGRFIEMLAGRGVKFTDSINGIVGNQKQRRVLGRR